MPAPEAAPRFRGHDDAATLRTPVEEILAAFPKEAIANFAPKSSRPLFQSFLYLFNAEPTLFSYFRF
jgi:hypothetical protein